jgi:hypothetical protein
MTAPTFQRPTRRPPQRALTPRKPQPVSDIRNERPAPGSNVRTETRPPAQTVEEAEERFWAAYGPQCSMRSLVRRSPGRKRLRNGASWRGPCATCYRPGSRRARCYGRRPAVDDAPPPCPGCGDATAPGDSTWPIPVDGAIIDGGCTACWEDACSRAWWAVVAPLSAATADDAANACAVKPVKFERLPRGRALSSGEIAALIAACTDDSSALGFRDGALISVAYSTGARRGEEVKRKAVRRLHVPYSRRRER